MIFHFSKRTDWALGENELSLSLKDMRARGEEFLDLTQANPTCAGFARQNDTVLSPLVSPASLLYAPEARGALKVRTAISSYYSRKGVQVPEDRLLLTASTSEAYSFLFRLLTEPGDQVLIPAPGYPLFSYLADINDIEAVHYELRLEDGVWKINFESIEQVLGPRVRAVILVSPNNPTGSCVKALEIAQLNRLCAAHALAIISDEVFADYMFPGHEQDFTSLAGNEAVLSFALGGLSKSLALPQMKLAWIAANGPRDVLAEALSRLEVIADTYLSVGTPVQNAAAEWLPVLPEFRDRVLARVTGNYLFLQKYLAAEGVATCVSVEGGWYALIHQPGLRADEAWAIRLLKEDKVSVHPGFFFDFRNEEYVVVSLLTLPADFETGVRRLCQRLRSGEQG